MADITAATTGYKKRAIPMATRRAVALINGCDPGGRIIAHCYKCQAPGTITWWPRRDGTPGPWVHFGGLELDHVHPESKGGVATPDNIALLCRPCNRRKGSRVG